MAGNRRGIFAHMRCGSLFVLAALAPLATEAGVIRGKVQFASAQADDDLTEAVVFVATKDFKEAPPAQAARMAQKKRQFQPRVLAIVAGQAVEFENQDAIYHNVFALGPVSKFDLGKYEQGRSKSVTFDKVGVQEIFCDIHRTMLAAVVVLPNRAFATPAADGTFEIKGVPAGKHTVRVWHRKGKAAPVEVSVDSAAAQASFSLDRVDAPDRATVDKYGQPVKERKGY